MLLKTEKVGKKTYPPAHKLDCTAHIVVDDCAHSISYHFPEGQSGNFHGRLQEADALPSAVNIYPWGEGVGCCNSLFFACVEKFQDCAIIVWSFVHFSGILSFLVTHAQILLTFVALLIYEQSEWQTWVFGFASLPSWMQHSAFICGFCGWWLKCVRFTFWSRDAVTNTWMNWCVLLVDRWTAWKLNKVLELLLVHSSLFCLKA